MTRALPLIVTLLVVGCDFSGLKDLGERCGATDECGDDAECVIVDDNQSHCLPRPARREERSCSSDDDCLLSDGQLWPVESECIDGSCRCLSGEVFCEDDDGNSDDFSVILEEETCRCVPRGNEGDTCITSHTCDIGLACTSGECRSAAEQAGSACQDSSDCGQFTCSEFRDNNLVGVCR